MSQTDSVQPTETTDLALARAALRAGRLEEAERGFQAACDADLSRPDGYTGLAQVAQARGDWHLALARWEAYLERFPTNPPLLWRLAHAWALLHVGRATDAAAAFTRLSDQFSNDSRAFVGLAHCAMRQRQWGEAVLLWDDVLARFPGEAQPAWLVARAQCLETGLETVRAAEAYAAIIERHPEQALAHHSYVWLMLSLGRLDEAAAASARALRVLPDDRKLLMQAPWVAMKRRDMAAARRALPQSIAAADTVKNLEIIFGWLPAAFEGWERTSALLALEQRLATVAAAAPPAETAEAQALAMRLKLALRDHDGFLHLFDAAPHTQGGVWMKKLRKTARLLRARRFPDFRAEKVFGIGLSKTGTTSLTLALSRLGFHSAHYFNDLTCEVLGIEDTFLFDALTDIPISGMFETLYHLFPKAKFIYTTRPLQDWAASFERHYWQVFRSNGFDQFRDQLTSRGMGRHGVAHAVVHGAVYYHHADPIAARTAFEARVSAFFAANDRARLLEFDIFSGDGWEKLCSFLDRPVPDEPFPWANKAAGEAEA